MITPFLEAIPIFFTLDQGLVVELMDLRDEQSERGRARSLEPVPR